MRLDKYLAQMSVGTRSEVKKIIKSGRVFVDGMLAEKPELKLEPEAVVTVDGQTIVYEKYEYFMLNKPQGYVSAVRDKTAPTVVSLIRDSKKEDLFPVGRLDKDTEGLLLLTNDGVLAHELLSPKRHVWKTYLVKSQGHVTEEDMRRLEEGVDIGDERKTLPAKIERIEGTGEEYTWLELSIREGRYHQVKRMMKAVGKPVVYLKRLSMGGLHLDTTLMPGQYRRLTEEEKIELRGLEKFGSDDSDMVNDGKRD